MKRNVSLIIVILLCLLRIAWGQETTGQLIGRILDEQEGHAIPAVNVVVTSPQLQGERGAATNDDGYFRVLALPTGFYTVKISHVAYRVTTVQRVPIHLGKTTSLGEIQLLSRVLELSEIIVSGEKPIIDPFSTTIGENLQYETIDVLPVDRNFQSISALIPQANTSYYVDNAGGTGTEQVNISGSTGPENAYFIDGVNVTDPFFAATSSNLPYNFVQEMEIKTGGYQAEYGRSLGGIINVITPSGSNEFHGQVFGFFTNDEFGGDPGSVLKGADVDGFSIYDFGLSLSGPVIHDRLWFYAAYNPNFDREQLSIPGLGTLRDRTISHLFAGKLTWRAPGYTDLILSLFGDPRVQHKNVVPYPTYSGFTIENKDVLLRRIEQGGINISLQVRRAFGQKLFLTGYLSYLATREKNVPETERGRYKPFIADVETGTISGGGAWMRDNKPSRLSAKINGSLFWGRHELKMGLEYEDNMLDEFVGNTGPMGFTQKISDSSYVVSYGSFGGNVHNRVPSVFLQDSWQIIKRLRLNAGLRWDAQYFIGSDGKVAQSITDQFQPRIGFIYQPGELGTAKAFGSYGRFYEQIPTLFPGYSYVNTVNITALFDHNPAVDPSGADTLDFSSSIHAEVEDLHGQYFDEFIIGYEQRIWKQFKISIRGIYRTLRQVVETGFHPETGEYIVGNPGQGNLDFFPKFKRDYKALEISIQRYMGRRFNFIASYVLSRNLGSYTGLFNADYSVGFPNVSPVPSFTIQIPNSEGLLPNDRPHVFKFSGSYLSKLGLTIGASFIWQSGTPITELGTFSGLLPYFLSERGSAGRTPAIADLNLRLKYNLAKFGRTGFQPSLIVDAFHVFNQRKAVTVDQTHYFALDESGNPIAPNPNYLNAVRFHPARTVRLGMEIKF